MNVILGVVLPFLGTSLGAAAVFLMKKGLNAKTESMLTGFASGVMMAASVWSLLIPSIHLSENLGKLSFAPAVISFLIGAFSLLFLEKKVEQLKKEGKRSKNFMLIFAVTLHNFPEGMAVGVLFAGYMLGENQLTMMMAFALSIGIALQNIPEGAIVSLPLRAEGKSKKSAFFSGVLSGVVEPLGAVLTIVLAKQMVVILPYMLGFAAGAMIYVVMQELVPRFKESAFSKQGIILFLIGFALMMTLDVVFS